MFSVPQDRHGGGWDIPLTDSWNTRFLLLVLWDINKYLITHWTGLNVLQPEVSYDLMKIKVIITH